MRTIERTTICVVLTIAPFVGIGCMLNHGGPPKLTRKEPKIFAVQRDKPLSAKVDTNKQISPSSISEKTEAPSGNPGFATGDQASLPSTKADGKSSKTNTAASLEKPEIQLAVAESSAEPKPETKITLARSTARVVLSPSNVILAQSSTATVLQFADTTETNPESSQIKLAGHEESTDSESEEIEFEIPNPVSLPVVHPDAPERAWDAPDADEIEESIETTESKKADEWSSSNGFEVQVEKNDDRDFQQVCLVKFKEERVFTPGLQEFTAEYRAQRYRFSSAEAAERFQADPEQFVPTAGGLDIVAFGNNREVVHGSLDFAVWYNKHLFLFSNHENIAIFQRQPEKFMAMK